MAIEDFDADWEIDFPRSIIRRKNSAKLEEYNLTDFWRWVRKEEATSKAMSWRGVIDSDGMGPAYGVPRKIKLVNGYTIEPHSLKFLKGKDTVLLDSNNQVLVSDQNSNKRWWENSFVQGGLILIAIVGLLLAI